MSTTTSTIQTTYSWHQHNQRTEQKDLTLPTDRNWPITTDERYLSLTAKITAKLTNQFSPTRLITFDWQTTLSLDSDEDFRSGCRNVSHCHRQQSFSGLLLTRTITLHDQLHWYCTESLRMRRIRVNSFSWLETTLDAYIPWTKLSFVRNENYHSCNTISNMILVNDRVAVKLIIKMKCVSHFNIYIGWLVSLQVGTKC